MKVTPGLNESTLSGLIFAWTKFRESIERKFLRGLNFANQPVFPPISFIFLGVLTKIAILKISRGQNFAKMAKIRENPEN